MEVISFWKGIWIGLRVIISQSDLYGWYLMCKLRVCVLNDMNQLKIRVFLPFEMWKGDGRQKKISNYGREGGTKPSDLEWYTFEWTLNHLLGIMRLAVTVKTWSIPSSMLPKLSFSPLRVTLGIFAFTSFARASQAWGALENKHRNTHLHKSLSCEMHY